MFNELQQNRHVGDYLRRCGMFSQTVVHSYYFVYLCRICPSTEQKIEPHDDMKDLNTYSLNLSIAARIYFKAATSPINKFCGFEIRATCISPKRKK